MAEVITLRCTPIPDQNGVAPKPFTLDVDFTNHRVTSSVQSPHVSQAETSDRYVYYLNDIQRIDRMTGVLAGRRADGTYGDWANCRRVTRVF